MAGKLQLRLPPPNTILAVLASLTATVAVLRNHYNELIPEPIRRHFSTRLQHLMTRFSSQITITLHEVDGVIPDHMFESASLYLGKRLFAKSRRIRVYKPENQQHLSFSIDRNEPLVDTFQGAEFKWVLVSTLTDIEGPTSKYNRHGNGIVPLLHFELTFHKKHRDLAVRFYLPYILGQANAMRSENRVLKLHTIDYKVARYWGAIQLNHPATFDTIAMNPESKRALIDDLDRFIQRRQYYRRVGKAWKRGYLLYGPPGTGKSSLIAAMANYLKFDIYDLDLKQAGCNSYLRKLLIGTGSRSMLVIEDIDCSIDLQDRSSDPAYQTGSAQDIEKITLSGLLNFLDGLWSSCGDERIVVLTTNHVDMLDPALMRPGRMDLHVHMSYCDFSGFKILANNYLSIREHTLFEQIEGLLEQVEATPAELAGELMKTDDVTSSLEGVIQFLLDKQEAGKSLDLLPL